jgi:hypothetical protein
MADSSSSSSRGPATPPMPMSEEQSERTHYRKIMDRIDAKRSEIADDGGSARNNTMHRTAGADGPAKPPLPTYFFAGLEGSFAIISQDSFEHIFNALLGLLHSLELRRWSKDGQRQTPAKKYNVDRETAGKAPMNSIRGACGNRGTALQTAQHTTRTAAPGVAMNSISLSDRYSGFSCINIAYTKFSRLPSFPTSSLSS